MTTELIRRLSSDIVPGDHGQYESEAPFAPRIDAKDDCRKLSDGPVCRIELPHKLCSGTHSCWADGDAVRGGLLSAA